MNLVSILENLGYECCPECEDQGCELNMECIRDYAILNERCFTHKNKMADGSFVKKGQHLVQGPLAHLR